jgi:hypothetical protein
MRTTLTIDDDVLTATKDLAARRRITVGAVISELAREALRPRAQAATTCNGIALLPGREGARPVTLEMVNELRDAED